MGGEPKFSPMSDLGGNSPEARGRRLIHARGNEAQASFASKIGAHKNTYGHWERGRTDVSADALAALVGLGWNANWLLTGVGPERLSALEQQQSHATLTYDQRSQLDHEALYLALALVDYREAKEGPYPRRKMAETLAERYEYFANQHSAQAIREQVRAIHGKGTP